MERVIRNQYLLYPKSEICDWFKLIYQSEFGNTHMSSNAKLVQEELVKEMKTAKDTDHHKEDIGNGHYRINLGWLKNSELSVEVFNRILMLSREMSEGTFDGFWKKISVLEQSIKDIPIPVNLNDFHAFEQDYFKKGCPLLNHSEIYKEEYKPSYRVVRKEFAEKIDLWIMTEKLVEHAKRNGTFVNIAIDGMSTSGKTTLGQMFEKLFDCNVIHTDDFFLKKNQRTYERLTQPGGNIDYERFKHEIVNNLNEPTGFIYYAYDCRTSQMSEKKAISKHLNIVEGAYSMHPYFGNIYDIRIFMETDKLTQLERVLKRNGEELFDRFKNEWIPMENKYHNIFKIKENCTFIYRT